MKQGELSGFFEDYIKKESLFKSKKALQANFIPKDVPYRETQIKQLANMLAPCLKNEKPSNIFIYGKTGTGKTLCVKHVVEQMLEIAEKNKISLKIVYLNCKLKRIADTEYRLIAQITRELGIEVPATGLPTEEVYKLFINSIEEKKTLIVLILDEIDQLIGKIGDEIIYNFTRLGSELKYSNISLIGISNSSVFTDTLDPRVKSSLSEEEITFPAYDAVQLQKILKQRADVTFEKNVVDNGVIEKCAAYAAREHGDARRALELMRVAGELAERDNAKTISIDYIDKAEEKVEKDRVFEVIETQPKQSKLVLYSIFVKCFKNDGAIFTGDIYEIYKNLSFKTGARPLTQRRVSDIIAELDMLGVINTKVISKGRYGRTREIGLALPQSSIPKFAGLLKESLSL